LRQRDEVLQLQFQQPVLIDQGAAIDIAAAQYRGDPGRDFHVVLGNEAAFEHVDQHHLEGGNTDIAGNRNLPCRQRWAVAALGQRAHLRLGDKQQFMRVEYHHIAFAGEAQFLGFQCRGGHLGHRYRFKIRLQAGKHIATSAGGQADAGSDFFQAAAGRQQADPGLDQADIAFQRQYRARCVHLELAAAAQRQAAHCGNHRHQGIFYALTGGLEVGNHGGELVDLAGLKLAHRALEVGARRKRFAVLPDHQAAEIFFGNADRLLQAVEHGIGDRMHLGFEADHRDAVAVVPHAHAVVLEHGFAAAVSLAQHRVGEALAAIHRQRRAWFDGVAAGAVAALGVVHAGATVHRPGR